MQDYERLGVFYLGKLFDQQANAPTDELLLYDSRDLTTHAVCVGMTGSGKTGLCLAMLEEALLDGIPAIAIDPKGDLANLLLTFPSLAASDFRPWVDEGEAARKGLPVDEYAARVAETWKKGLADWGQDGERIARLRAAADLAVYTPGASAGLQISLLDSFAPPPAAIAGDEDAYRERLTSTVAGLLALLAIESDPLRGREHVFLASLLDRAWRLGKSLSLAELVRGVATPPFERVGVLDLESFYPSKDRAGLAAALNGLAASPGFAAWTEGEPLDAQRLLWTPEGKPRLSILSIAHLSDAERMFFVTALLSEVVAWMRTQSGTPSLRAILYMDEVFGYFPPIANPPSKTPMLTLMKQARAFGVGVVLATQNPADLDYKGLSNAGTWFLGRLQTERDKKRVVEGLEGLAASQSGFDRQTLEATLAGLGSRVFLLNNVHDDAPVLFQSRWAMSYLRGPLTKQQIRMLMAARKSAGSVAPSAAPAAPSPRAAETARPAPGADRPVLPAEAGEAFLAPAAAVSGPLRYQPALLGRGRIHFASSKAGVDAWEEVTLLARLSGDAAQEPWTAAVACTGGPPPIEREPRAGATFETAPPAAQRAKSYAGWSKALADELYRTRSLTLFSDPAGKQLSKPHESEGDFRARISHSAREGRDKAVEALRKKYAPKLATLQDRLRRAEERVAKEKAQSDQAMLQTGVSIGATVLGALFGRKKLNVGTIGRATTAARGVGRSLKERGDIGTAEEGVDAVRQRIAELEAELKAESEALGGASAALSAQLERVEIKPKKADLGTPTVTFVWIPE